MSVEIEVTGLVFKCQTDEDICYQRLAQVTGVKKIVSELGNVYLSVDSSQQKQAVDDIRTICDIWHASFQICN